MAKRVSKFEKVSYKQFEKDWINTYGIKEVDDNVRQEIVNIYSEIILPKRATKFSAGYDFFTPVTFKLDPGEYIKIPTGVRCTMHNNYVLQIYPRSSLGFKYMLVPMNLVPIVDSDYYYSDNEGHIFMKMKNCGDKTVTVTSGEAFCQGIFIEYGITEDDSVTNTRNGGIGSTTSGLKN